MPSVIRGTLITFAFQAVALLLGFATRSILARLLHTDGLGLFEFFRFIPTFLHAATNLGINNSLVNFILVILNSDSLIYFWLYLADK